MPRVWKPGVWRIGVWLRGVWKGEGAIPVTPETMEFGQRVAVRQVLFTDYVDSIRIFTTALSTLSDATVSGGLYDDSVKQVRTTATGELV